MKIIKNEHGEIELTKRQVLDMSKEEIAKALRRFNNWRRGKGIYKWDEDPLKNKPCPFSPATIGHIIDATIDVLKG